MRYKGQFKEIAVYSLIQLEMEYRALKDTKQKRIMKKASRKSEWT